MGNIKHEHKLNIPDPINVQMTPQPKPKLGENGRYFIGLLFLIFGWGVSSILVSFNNRKNKALEIKTSYSIETYNQLVRALRLRKTQGFAHDVEDALSRIQLYGTHEQIKIAHEAMNQFAADRDVDAETLLQSLRNDLRSELGLDEENSSIKNLTFDTTVNKNGYYIVCQNTKRLVYTGLPFDISIPFNNSLTRSFVCPNCKSVHTWNIAMAKALVPCKDGY